MTGNGGVKKKQHAHINNSDKFNAIFKCNVNEQNYFKDWIDNFSISSFANMYTCLIFVSVQNLMECFLRNIMHDRTNVKNFFYTCMSYLLGEWGLILRVKSNCSAIFSLSIEYPGNYVC